MRLFLLLFFFFFSPFSFSQTCNPSFMKSYPTGGSTSWLDSSGTSEYFCIRTESHVHSGCSGSAPAGYSLKSYIDKGSGAPCRYDAVWLLIKPYVPPPPPPPCSSTNGQPLFVGQVPVSSSDVIPSSVCENKCLYASSSMKGDHVGISGKYWFVPHEGKAYVGTGSQCNPSDLGSPTSPESELAQKLKQGYCPGQVNGVDVYVKCSSVSADTPTAATSTTQKADGSTVKTDSKSTTTCEGGSCNTTTTTTNTTINPDGSTAGTETKTDTKTESKETFCKENPTFAACVPSGFSASSCGAAPSCTGDAIQCAIVQQQHKSYCELMATPTAISELGVAAASGQAIPADHPLAQAEASPFNFSSAFTGASGGGGCPADVTVMGVTVPLSNTCEGLNALGLAALGISLIWAARVVFGG